MKCKRCCIEIDKPIIAQSFTNNQPINLGEFCEECFEQILVEIEKESEE